VISVQRKQLPVARNKAVRLAGDRCAEDGQVVGILKRIGGDGSRLDQLTPLTPQRGRRLDLSAGAPNLFVP